MNILIKRKGAAPRPVSDKVFVPDILAICEWVTPGRTPAPSPTSAGSLRLRAGAIYKLVTGLAIEGIERPWQVYAAALGPQWKEGLLVHRVDVQPEIAFYVEAVGEVTVSIGQGLVALELIDRAAYSLETAQVVMATTTPLPPLGFSAHVGGERIVRASPTDAGGQTSAGKQVTEAELERKGAAWLDEDDGKGKAVGTDAVSSAGASVEGAILGAPPASGGMPSITPMTNRDISA